MTFAAMIIGRTGTATGAVSRTAHNNRANADAVARRIEVDSDRWKLGQVGLLFAGRHTFASLLLQNGESLHSVKEQLGHASIQTTVDVYGHLVPGANRNAVNRLDQPIEPDPALIGAVVG